MVTMVMMVRQQVVLDPTPMRIARISGAARWAKRCSCGHRRADLYQRLISSVTTGLEFAPMSESTKCQTPRRAGHTTDGYARASPGSFLFE
jgi:hypothetical protein